MIIFFSRKHSYGFLYLLTIYTLHCRPHYIVQLEHCLLVYDIFCCSKKMRFISVVCCEQKIKSLFKWNWAHKNTNYLHMLQLHWFWTIFINFHSIYLNILIFTPEANDSNFIFYDECNHWKYYKLLSIYHMND